MTLVLYTATEKQLPPNRRSPTQHNLTFSWFALALVCVLAEIGCGSHLDPIPQVQPASATVTAGASQQFSVRPLFGGTQWLINGVAGGSARLGVIDTNGLYTAPVTALANPISVTAQSIGASGQRSSATVQLVNPPPTISSLSPSCSVANGSPITVAIRGAGFTPGSVVQAGSAQLSALFVSSQELHVTVPAELTTSGGVTLHVSNSLPGGGASDIVLPILSPASANVFVGDSVQFNLANPDGVAWAVNGQTGGTNATGTISSSGLYTAPATVPSAPITITATSAKAGSSPLSASISVVPSGTLAGTTHPLVARYTVTAPVGSSVHVEFGPDLNYGRSTWAQPAAALGDTSMLVAGMKPNSQYHVRGCLELQGGPSTCDVDRVFTTGALPARSFPSVTVKSTGTTITGEGINLTSAFGTDASVVGLDMDGSVIWYYLDQNDIVGGFPVRQLPNGNFLINMNTSDVREVDLEGNIVRSISKSALNSALAGAGYNFTVQSIHHDVLELPNKHWILLVNETKDFQNLDGYPGTTTVTGDSIVDLDENNTPVWVWRAFDHLDVNRHPIWFPDWTHANGLVYTVDGNLLLSLRHQSWVIKIDYKNGQGSGNVLWRLGAGGDFAITGGDAAQWFYNQHHPTLLSTNGAQDRISIFDNGNTRLDPTAICTSLDLCYSRAVIFDIDEAAMTASVEWQFKANWFGFWGGSTDVLANGNVVMTSSALFLDPADTTAGTMSKMVEVTGTSTPSVVWEMDVKNANLYRSNRVPSLYPGVQW